MWRSAAPILSLFALLFVAPSSSYAHEVARDACLSQVRMAVSMVTLNLVDRVGLAQQSREEMMRETIKLWRAAGVHVTWSTLPPGGTAEAPIMERSRPQVSVIITPAPPEELQPGAAHAPVLASILFIGGKPTTLIGAYPGEVQRLLETVRLETRAIGDRPAALQHRMMGRVLGRAIAHELGHFLFNSADHAPDGLMRAKHRLDDLTSPFPQAFRVIPARPFACAVDDVSSADGERGRGGPDGTVGAVASRARRD